MNVTEVENIIYQLNEKLSTPKLLGNDELRRRIEVCILSYQQIKALVGSKEFESQEEEILFFKHIKPRVTSLYFYHLKMFQIETAVPMSSTEMKIRYYKDQMKRLDNFTFNHREFSSYIKRNATYMDHVYFTRGNKNPELFTNYQYIDMEWEFATSHGFVLARLLANEKLSDKLQKKIRLLEDNFAIIDNLIDPIAWSGTKVNLVVLMYGLIETNQVSCDIATLANRFNKLFGIDLKDSYRIWLDVKSRKKEDFPWLQQMIDQLRDRASEE